MEQRDQKVRVVFLVLTTSIWPSVSSVWEACQTDERVTATVVLVPNQFADRQAKDFQQTRAFLIEQNIPFLHAHESVLADLKPDVVFMPLPYSAMYPPYLNEEALFAAGIRMAYVPYGLEMGGGGYNMQYQFNQRLHNKAWRIFARSPSHRRMFARYCASGSGHVVVTGAPRRDQLARLQEQDAGWLEERIKGRKAILWTPHFSEGGEAAWSSFGPYREQILDLFPKLADTHALILRPHPLLFSHLRNGGYWTPADEAAFRERIAASENIILDETSPYLPAFKAADAIMADAGSFLLEFFATGKPVLYMSPQGGIGLNDDGVLTEHLYVCRGRDDVTAFVEQIGRGEDPTGDRRRAALDQFFSGPETGTVGQAILNHIVDGVRAGDGLRTPFRVENEHHWAARAFWAAAGSPYVAEAEFYARKDVLLGELLARHGPWESALDVGCGDGRYTRMLAKRAAQVTGCDINSSFVEFAKLQAAEAGVANVKWIQESLDDVRTLSRYEMISCCGVLSSFTDIRAYTLAVSLLHAMVKPGGLLLVEDTLSPKNAMLARDPAAGYVALYRNEKDYVDSFTLAGFELVEEVPISPLPGGDFHRTFFLFRRG